MKRLLIALLAATSLGCVAHAERRHDDRWDRRHHEYRIPDRVERTVINRDGRRFVRVERFRCVEQRRGRCLDWDRVSVRHERRYRD